MTDDEKCITVSANMPENAKITNAGGDAAWLWVCSLAYARRNNTDGIVPVKRVPMLSDRKQPMRLARKLVDEHLWHEPGHDCKACPQPMPGNYVIHDYLRWQPGAAEQAAVREAKETGGAYGNHRRWHAARNRPDPTCEFCASHMRSVDRSDSESDEGSDNRSHMRSVEGSLTDRSTESGPNRTSDDQRNDGGAFSPSPPVKPEAPARPPGVRLRGRPGLSAVLGRLPGQVRQARRLRRVA